LFPPGSEIIMSRLQRDIFLDACSAARYRQNRKSCQRSRSVGKGPGHMLPLVASVMPLACSLPCRCPPLIMAAAFLASIAAPPYRRHLRSCPFLFVVRRHLQALLMPLMAACFPFLHVVRLFLLDDTAVSWLLRAVHSRSQRPGSYGAMGGGRSSFFSHSFLARSFTFPATSNANI
jgi:hypothetical protein